MTSVTMCVRDDCSTEFGIKGRATSCLLILFITDGHFNLFLSYRSLRLDRTTSVTYCENTKSPKSISWKPPSATWAITGDRIVACRQATPLLVAM